MTTENSNQLQNAGIQQMSIAYHKIEDRLFLKIGMANNYELTVWFTRKSAKLLASLLGKAPLTTTPVIADNDAQKSPQVAEEMTKNAVTQNLDFTTEYQQRKPLQKGKLLLAHHCQVSYNEKKQLSLELFCSNKQTLKLSLNDELLMALTNMLQLSIRQAEWDFELSNTALIPRPETSKHLLH